jgi:thiamine pyrophosphate-dependent acetolactate synthase large subunit-like protein
VYKKEVNLKKKKTFNFSNSGLAMGIAIGIAIGIALDNIGLGIGIGIVFGIAISSGQKKKK